MNSRFNHETLSLEIDCKDFFSNIRVESLYGEKFFCLQDVGRALGYSAASIKTLRDRCERFRQFPSKVPHSDKIASPNFISLQDVIRLCMCSRIGTPVSRKMKEWIIAEAVNSATRLVPENKR